VKPLFYLSRAILIFSTLALAGMLSACGQIGPLYMPLVPADPDAPAGTPAPAATVTRPLQMSTPAYGPNMSPMPSAFPNAVAH
jgi:predicted small lipoprotein YifL